MRKTFLSLLAGAALTLGGRAAATVPSPASSAGPYACNGAPTVFAVPFKFLTNGDLVVTKKLTATGAEADLVLTTDYTVAGAGASAGGSVTLTAGSKCPAGWTLSVKRVLSYTQGTSFRSLKIVSPAAVEAAVDRLTMADQQIVRDRDARDDAQDLALAQGAVGGNDTYITAAGSITPRKEKDRWADEANVLDFGAIPDDGRDDSAAFQLAVDSGKPIYCRGSYNVAVGIVVPGGSFRFRGKGACTITSSNADGKLLVFSGATYTNVELRDLELTTTRTNQTDYGWSLVDVNYSTVNGFLVERVRFDTAASRQSGIGFGVQIGGSVSNVTVRDSTFAGSAAGIGYIRHTAGAMKDMRAIGNVLRHNGAFVDKVNGIGITVSGNIADVEVSDNWIYDYPYAGIEIVADGDFDARWRVNRNHVFRCGRGLVTENGAAPASSKIRDVTIAGNELVDSVVFQRIESLSNVTFANNRVVATFAAASADHANPYVRFAWIEKMFASGNVFDLAFHSSEASKAQVRLVGVTNSTFVGNTIRSTGAVPLSLDSTGTADEAVTDNRFAATVILHEPNGASSSPVVLSAAATERNVFSGTTIKTTTAAVYDGSNAAASNSASGSMLWRSGALTLLSDFGSFPVTGKTLDLSKRLEVPRLIEFTGAPGSDFTVTLPPWTATYAITNAVATGVATITSTSGAAIIPVRATARVRVVDGVASYFDAPDLRGVSEDRGDASPTLSVRTTQPTQRFATTLTANRTVTLSTSGAQVGDWWRIVRTGLGAFTLDVGGIKTCPRSKACVVDVAWDGSAWRLSGYSEW